MADPLVTRADIEAAIGRDTVERLFDHNNDGVPDKPSLDLVCKHASSKVRGAIPAYDPADLTPANALISTELNRLAVDTAVAIIAKHWPGSAGSYNWLELMGQVDKELEMVRKGQANLGSRTNPTEEDHSVSVASNTTHTSNADYWP
jgi:hypothetical protein